MSEKWLLEGLQPDQFQAISDQIIFKQIANHRLLFPISARLILLSIYSLMLMQICESDVDVSVGRDSTFVIG